MSEAVGEQAGRPSEVSLSVVMKFGGTSVEDVAAIRRAAQIVRQRLRHKPVVVVSALSDVTDQLLEAGNTAALGKLQSATETLQSLQLRPQRLLRLHRSMRNNRSRSASSCPIPGSSPTAPRRWTTPSSFT